jgi:ribosomal RNA assembly protein
MEKLYMKNARKVIQNKKQIENILKVKLEIKAGIVTIEGAAEKELIALSALEAIDLGFTLPLALELRLDDFAFEKIPIKNIISRKRDLSQVRARIIGTKRRALDQIEYLTGCDIVLHENIVAIIGRTDDVKQAAYALRKLIAGSKHANVYAYLEEQNARQKAGIF